MAKGFNEGSDRVVDSWNNDWKMFFEDVCKRTGLTLTEAMQFHSTISAHATAQILNFFGERLQIEKAPPKEPWES